MSKYKNKRLHISAFDFVFVVIFLGFLISSGYFAKEYRETKDKFNIEQTKVDFIIEAPSREQINEIKARSDIENAVPYVYKSVKIKGTNKSVDSGLYIIDNIDDLCYTVFSDDLMVETSTTQPANPLYVSSDLAKNAGLSLNDTISISVLGQSIDFSITGIYKSDYRNVGGTAISIIQNDVKVICGNEYRYNGAYICSNDINATKSYIVKYIGQGDLRSSDEFDSEEAYQQYLENRKTKSSTESTFSRDDYIEELNKRYSDKLTRDFIISLCFIAGAVLFLFIDLCGKPNNYTKKEVEKDIRNNFALKQEKQMYSKYSTIGFLIYLGATALYFVISHFFFGNELISINSIIIVAAIVLFSIIARAFSISRLINHFSVVTDKTAKKDEG